MTEEEAAATDDVDTTTEAQDDPEESGMAGAVDDKAAELMGSQGAANTSSEVADNRGAVAQAEEHLEDTNLDADRETLKKLQGNM